MEKVMARLDGIRERRHQPFWDTLVRGIGISSVGNLTQLFGNANVGNRALTNLQVAGVLASDQTYIIKVLRSVLFFQGIADSEFGSYGSLPDLSASATGSNSRAEDLYMLMAYGAYFNLNVGDKPMFFAPIWYAPAGGGPAGYTTENSRHVIANGVQSHESVLKLGKDIHVPARQNFNVTIEFFPFARLGAGQGGAYAADLNPLDYLNQFDGAKLFQFYVDGVQTRDVQ
jgi:hypothetical protein